MSKPTIVPDGHPDKIRVWTDPKGCASCKCCSIEPMDMDPICRHPQVTKSRPDGLYIDRAIELFCGNPHTLWVKK